MVLSTVPVPRRDKEETRTYTQTVASNTSEHQATVGEVLRRKGGSVVTIRPQATLGQAVEILSEKNIGALVVTDANGQLAGILSERDIVRKLAVAPGKTLPHLVEQVMTHKVQTCRPDTRLVDAERQMIDGHFRHMPVADESGLLGMVTIGDVVTQRLILLEHETLQLKQLVVG